MQQRVFLVESYCDKRKQPHMSLGFKVFHDVEDMNSFVKYLADNDIPNNWTVAPIYNKGELTMTGKQS